MLDIVNGFLTAKVQLGKIILPFSLQRFLIQFILPVTGIYIAYRILLLLIRRFIRKTDMADEAKKRISAWIRTLMWLIAMAGIILLFGRLFEDELPAYVTQMLDFIQQPFYESGSTRISIITIFLLLPIFWLATVTARVSRRFFESSILNRTSLDQSKRFSILGVIRFTVMLIVILIGLSVIGIDLSSIALIFGVFGIGIGFGLQTMVANLFAGLAIIFSQPIKENDFIQLGEHEGTIVQIKLLSSIMTTLTNETLIIPNSDLIEKVVHNYSYNNRNIIIMNSVQVAYGTDLEHVSPLLFDAAAENPYRDKQKDPEIVIQEFSASGITIRLYTSIRDVKFKRKAFSWTNMSIWRTFRKNNITIPFPQMDVHFDNGETVRLAADTREDEN